MGVKSGRLQFLSEWSIGDREMRGVGLKSTERIERRRVNE